MRRLGMWRPRRRHRVAQCVTEAIAAMRNSPQGRYVALGFGYRSVDEFAACLESDEIGIPATQLVPGIMRRLSEAEGRAKARAERQEYEDFGRDVVKALQHYAKANGRLWRGLA